MIGPEHAKDILEQALKASTAEQTEVMLFAQDMELTRFANNIIHQNVAETDTTLTVRAVMGKRRGMATTNNLSAEGIGRAVDSARQSALRQPEDPDFGGLSGPHSSETVHAFDEDTAACSPEERAKGVGIICRKAKEKGILNGSGYFRTGTQEMSIANSLGTRVYHAGSVADISVTAMTDDSAGRAQLSAWKVRELDPEAIGDEAIGKATRGRNPRKIDPGEYTIVAEPYVADDLVFMLAWIGMSAQSVQEGRSWMNDRMGQQAMSPLVSIWDDGQNSMGYPMPFDFEGIPKQRVDIVAKGLIGSPVYDTYSAGKEGKLSTGHASPPGGGLDTSFPLNLFMAAGEQSVDEMIKSTERGLYIATFWYTRPMHPRDAVITGMTRDGVFMIENGEITYPVKNLRFTQSYVKALADVEMVSSDTRLLISEPFGASRVPALKIKAFNFTGSTV
jgi:predicted Zn-dependent protease